MPRGFGHLARQERPRQLRLGGNTLAHQHMGMAPLVLGGAEISQLDPPFAQKAIQNIMNASGADPDGLRQLALRHFRVIPEKAQNAHLCILAQFVALGRHCPGAFSQATAQGLPSGRLGMGRLVM